MNCVHVKVPTEGIQKHRHHLRVVIRRGETFIGGELLVRRRKGGNLIQGYIYKALYMF